MASAEIERVIQYLDAHRPLERTLSTLRAYVDAMVGMEPVAADIVVEPITLGGVPTERLTAPGADRARTLLYFHGGGYSLGSAKGYRPLTGRIARAFGGVVLVPDYRLAPEHPFPAGLDDAIATCRAVTAESGTAQLFLGGDSAGGGLALSTMLSLRDAGLPLPAAAALLSPWVDLDGTRDAVKARASEDPIISPEGIENLARLYLGDRDRRQPLAAPTHASLAGLPPILLQTGTREVQLDDARAFAEKLRAAGVSVTLEVWEGMLHVFQMFPVLPEAHRAVARIGEFLRAGAAS